ncbi:MAG: radical SAM protein [Halothece sp. Uz-M2-17]|nr:radical SAM protein [Halothece sp. Uz-M2-17]
MLREIAKSELDRLEQLGVDLSQYPSVWKREQFSAIAADHNRNINHMLWRAFQNRLTGQIPDPLMLTHIVTTRCNYSCHFCSFADTLNAKTKELSLEEIEKTYATLGENLNVIIYSGGETTLHPNLAEIIEAAYRLTPVKSVYIISNAWKPERLFQITHRLMQRCPELHLTWSLSIEGKREMNNSLRYTRQSEWDAYQNTIDSLLGLQTMRDQFSYDQLDVQLCTVCSPDNADQMDDWYEMVRDVLKPDKWNLNLMRKSVQMSEHELASFEQRRQNAELEPFEEKYLEITNRIREDVLSGKLKFLYHTQSHNEGAMKSAVDLISQEQNRRTLLGNKDAFCCRAGTLGAYIGSEGDVSGCEEFAHNPQGQKVFGNLRSRNYDFQGIWHSATAQNLRSQVGNAPECYGCTLESQRNYPSILVSLKTLVRAKLLSEKIQ